MKTKTLLMILALFALTAVAGCGGEPAQTTPTADPSQSVSPENTAVPPTPTEEPDTEAEVDEATVESIEIVTLESFPVQVQVRARGIFPDGCTELDKVISEQDGNAFTITLTTARQSEDACTEAVVPFEETIPLDVDDLEAGTYMVTVNGISGSFTLNVDNRLPEGTAQPTPEATSSSSATINGRVWHDLCVAGSETAAAGDDEEEEEAEPPEGCVAAADDSFQANGLLEDDEPGIEGVLISLGEGECPATEVETAVTDENGDYAFSDLEAGTYCVFIDPLDTPNSDILLPGGWTFPETDANSSSVTLAAGATVADVNFGWDYEFRPVPEVDLENCTNSIEFVEDLNIPDDTVFPPGQELIKSWRLRNNGTCPWTTEYSLTYVGGDDIPGPESVPLSEPVAPGETVDLSVTLTAPEEPGTYRENWQISDANGDPFGVNGFIEDAFWLQIVVEEGAEEVEPSSATIGGVVWDDACRLLDDGSPSAGCVETAEDSGFYRADGTFNNNESGMSGIVVTLSDDACPDEGAIAEDQIVDTTTTGEDGRYRFTGLNAGLYCVSIDAFSDDNVDALIPGDWTYPFPGVGRVGIDLDAGEEILDVDFGWDHED